MTEKVCRTKHFWQVHLTIGRIGTFATYMEEVTMAVTKTITTLVTEVAINVSKFSC
jgi:hypothetical protein